MRAVIWIIVIAVIVLVAWWVIFYYYNPSNNGGPAAYAPAASSTVTPGASGPYYATSSSTTTQGARQTVLTTGMSAALGTYLTAPNGMTLYRYTKDTRGSGSSTCYGTCAAIWPPYVVSSSAAAEGTLDGATGTIGAITRVNGAVQVTYNGWPLYFYSKDAAPGDTTGQNVQGIWFVVAP